MSRINRRHLLQSSGVGLSSLSVPLPVLASQTGTKREYVSELTDSVVELLDDESVFLFHLMSIVEEEDYTEEFVSIDLRRATLYPSFVQTRLTPEAFMEMMSERLETWVTSGDFDNFTIGDFDSVDEGV